MLYKNFTILLILLSTIKGITDCTLPRTEGCLRCNLRSKAYAIHTNLLVRYCKENFPSPVPSSLPSPFPCQTVRRMGASLAHWACARHTGLGRAGHSTVAPQGCSSRFSISRHLASVCQRSEMILVSSAPRSGGPGAPSRPGPPGQAFLRRGGANDGNTFVTGRNMWT